MRLGVELKCCQRNTDICDLCQKKPFGDYWHRRNKSFLCRPCMLKERREHNLYTAPQLREFNVNFLLKTFKEEKKLINFVIFFKTNS